LSTAGALLKTRETNRASCSQLALRGFISTASFAIAMATFSPDRQEMP
jgi:hypothetical protein